MYEIVKQVCDLLSDEKNWCKDSAAQDLKGNVVTVHDTKAVKFCLLGALILYSKSVTEASFFTSYQAFNHYVNAEGGLIDFNDDPTTTHQDILNLINKVSENNYE